MILCFTGTGNSRYVARKLQEMLDDEVISINEYLKQNKAGDFNSEKPYVFVAPVYAWQMPRVVRKFILNSKFDGSKQAYFVLTCGASGGGAGAYAKKVCEEVGLKYMGTGIVVMPENYVAMFPVPSEEKSAEIVQKAEKPIHQIGECIAEENPLPEKISAAGKAMSAIMNKCFYKFFVSDKGFYVKDNCIGCGKCEQLCPLNNVSMKQEKPVWGGQCTHCMACICNCPVEAIEYKKKSIGKRRYYLE